MCFVSLAHPSAPLEPALLAAGELNGCSGRALLDAYGAALQLGAPPGRIEVFHNSRVSGAEALGAIVVAGWFAWKALSPHLKFLGVPSMELYVTGLVGIACGFVVVARQDVDVDVIVADVAENRVTQAAGF